MICFTEKVYLNSKLLVYDYNMFYGEADLNSKPLEY